MVIRALLRGVKRDRREPVSLPAPGPSPLSRPSRITVVIFVIIVGLVAWLLAEGYSPEAALGIVSMAGVAASEIASRLAGSGPAAE